MVMVRRKCSSVIVVARYLFINDCYYNEYHSRDSRCRFVVAFIFKIFMSSN
jgi:hypothetical protein